ncbi:MAG TPA: PAS domain S-box protein [Longimicrobiaceae bacterium]|nr:PAS domain S-box protein [Longimicrobiaceae bacterium]
MTPQPHRIADPDRLAAVREARLVEHPPGGQLDSLTRLARVVLRVPTALVTLLDAERETIESAAGLPGPADSLPAIPLADSLCRHIVASDEPLLVEDARLHERVRDGAAIRALGVAAYAGVPIRAPGGAVLGAFCAIDHLPRGWLADEVAILAGLAEAAEAEMARRLALRRERADASRFRTLVESSLAGMYLVQDGRIVYANPRFGALLGYGAGDAVAGRPILEFVVPEDRERVRENIRRRVEGEVDEVQYSFRALRKDGSAVEVEAHGSRTELDGRCAIVGTLLDVTERRRAEVALREAAERLRLVERATEDVIWEWDVRTGEVRWNEAGPKLFRYPPDEVGTTMEWHRQHIHPDDRERVIRSLQSELGGVGEIWSNEYRFRRGDGQYATVFDRGCVVRNERGEPVRILGSMVDVTERRRAEDAQRFLSRASVLLDSTLDGESSLGALARECVPFLGELCMIDLAEPDRGIRRVATAHQDPTREEPLTRVAEPAPRPVAADHPVATVLREGESIFLPEFDASEVDALGYEPGEAAALREVGVCSLMVVPLAAGEHRLGAVTVGTSDRGRPYTLLDLALVQDLAHRIALAVEHLRLYRQATEAVRARDEMLAVVSHDLRNPLNAIQMCATLLKEAGRDRRIDNQRFLELITRTSKQMGLLIDDLLDVGSMHGERFSVTPSRTSLEWLLGDAGELLGPLAAKKRIELETRVDPEASTAWLDPHQILRAISNLVGNAIKFTPEGGTITLRAEAEGEEVRISVSDSGPGIRPEHLPHVFTRFWQARPGDRRGAGLGLAITKGIVEAHGGRIWVESREGEGATFTFTVPAVGEDGSG